MTEPLLALILLVVIVWAGATFATSNPCIFGGHDVGPTGRCFRCGRRP